MSDSINEGTENKFESKDYWIEKLNSHIDGMEKRADSKGEELLNALKWLFTLSSTGVLSAFIFTDLSLKNFNNPGLLFFPLLFFFLTYCCVIFSSISEQFSAYHNDWEKIREEWLKMEKSINLWVFIGGVSLLLAFSSLAIIMMSSYKDETVESYFRSYLSEVENRTQFIVNAKIDPDQKFTIKIDHLINNDDSLLISNEYVSNKEGLIYLNIKLPVRLDNLISDNDEEEKQLKISITYFEDTFEKTLAQYFTKENTD